MTGGRPAKPPELHLLHGNPGKRTAKPTGLALTAEGLTCPEWLAADACEEWQRVAGLLAEHGMVSVADRAALAGYCQAYARWREMEEVLERNGLVMEIQRFDKAGNPTDIYLQQRPEVAIAQKYFSLMLTAAGKLGLDPISRTRLGTPQATEEDEFEAWLKGGQAGTRTGSE